MTYLTAYAEDRHDDYKPGWHELKTSKGCIFYYWDESYDPSSDEKYPENKWRYNWSGKCQAGKPISGKGKLTGEPLAKDGRFLEDISTYVNGRKEGHFEDSGVGNDDEAVYKGGCQIKSGYEDFEPSKTCVPVLTTKH